ncbi:MAG: response regulator [Pseudomonadota bacterium]
MTRVLIVEDDAAIARSLCLRLQANGFTTTHAQDVRSAKALAEQCAPDVAILDVSVPGGSGFVVAEHLRQRHAATHLVFLTADSQPETRSRAEDFQPLAFLAKPFLSEDLIAAVAAH